ncbi:MAG: hypothetical protein Q7J32_10835 [Sphingomonadaceae bacterium]|nr:hypothetical protein [Sphingomonadaceae bacterium]
MLETTNLVVMSASSIVAIAMLGLVWAWSWKGWLELKRHQLGTPGGQNDHDAMPAPQVGSRIELADLRERVKKLEAIAAGVDM